MKDISKEWNSEASVRAKVLQFENFQVRAATRRKGRVDRGRRRLSWSMAIESLAIRSGLVAKILPPPQQLSCSQGRVRIAQSGQCKLEGCMTLTSASSVPLRLLPLSA